MNLTTLILIAVGLAMDAFAVSMTCGIRLRHVTARQVLRIAAAFGGFQALMPVLGWLAGIGAQKYIEAWDHWIAFGLLAAVGGKAIYESLQSDEDKTECSDPTRGWTLLANAIATSIDAAAVGLSLAMLNVHIVFPALVIGTITALLCSMGMLAGPMLGRLFGKKVELAGGLILIGIGLKILWEHLN